MQRQVEKHIIKSNINFKDLCTNSKNLYNQTLYYLRQSYFGKIERFKEYELSKLMTEFNHPDYRSLPPICSQQIIRLCFQIWNSHFKALKEWNKNKNKFNGKPNLPNYKKEQFLVIFVKNQIKLKNGFIYFPKSANINPIKTKVNNICQVRLIPQATCHTIEIVYEKEITNLNLNKENILSLDLGLNNLATSINNVGLKPFIINGKVLKSFNQWFNKKKSKYQSFIGNKGLSNNIRKLNYYRKCWMDDKLHKISRYIVNYCIQNNIGTIIIGKNKDWKTSINIGKINNQNFTSIPHSKLIENIKYKSQSIGIDIKINEESYTSKCDALSLEPICKHSSYLGKRIKRGLFQSSIGITINADANGAINIARKVIGNDFVESLSNSSCALQHYKINIL